MESLRRIRFLTVIDNILDFSKIEAGRLDLERKLSLALRDLSREIVKRLGLRAERQRPGTRLFFAAGSSARYPEAIRFVCGKSSRT